MQGARFLRRPERSAPPNLFGFSALSIPTNNSLGATLREDLGLVVRGEMTGPPRAAASQGATVRRTGVGPRVRKAPQGHSGYLRRVRITQRDNERCDQAHPFSPLVAAKSAGGWLRRRPARQRLGFASIRRL